MSSSFKNEYLLRQEWLRILEEEWLETAGYRHKKDRAEQLGISPRTMRSWQNEAGPVEPDPGSLREILQGLYTLRDKEIGDTRRPPAAEVLDWMALLGRTADEVLDLVNGIAPPVAETDDADRPSTTLRDKMRTWLANGIGHQLMWPRPTIPSVYVERALTEQVEQALSSLKGCRQPACRAVVLYGATGSGKTTLAAAVMRSKAVQGYFRNGGLWLKERQWQERVELKQIGTEEIPPERWRQWIRTEETVGLVVVDDVTNRLQVNLLLAEMGPQVRLLITTQNQDTVRPGISGRLSRDEVLWLAVDKLTRSEGEQLVARQTGQAVSAQERDYLAWVVREIGYPGPLHLLADEAQSVGWLQVWQWLHQEQETPLTGHWAGLLHRDWQRLQIIEQVWLVRLVQGLPQGGSFGPVYAAIVWGETVDVANNRLQILGRRGWLEEIDNAEWGTPPQIAAALGQQRYRLLRPGLTFVRQKFQPHSWTEAWRRWLWGQRVNFRFHSLIKPPLEMTLASWITIAGTMFRVPIKVLLLVLRRNYSQWDQGWAGFA